MSKKLKAVVAMGSKSDLPIMKEASEVMKSFGVSVQTTILSAHRTPELLERESRSWEKKGVSVIVAGAGGAAHLPGMLASFSVCPVIGVPIMTTTLKGLDSLLSIAQMPKGIPVATVAVNGAYNAGLLACQILALQDSALAKKVKKYKTGLQSKVKKDRRKLSRAGIKNFLR